jgi:transposase
MGEDMAVDEKQVDKEMFTILSNRKTGKIALMTETLKVKQLLSLTDKFSDEKRWAVKTVTCDLSPSYHWFIRQAFIRATPIADKFHIIKHALDYLNDHRIRLKQIYLNEWRSICEKEERKVQHLKLQNGDTTLELLSRSRYILFKRQKDWTYTQKQRSVPLFKTYPQLHEDYLLIISFRDWYDKSNIGKETSLITQQLPTEGLLLVGTRNTSLKCWKIYNACCPNEDLPFNVPINCETDTLGSMDTIK